MDWQVWSGWIGVTRQETPRLGGRKLTIKAMKCEDLKLSVDWDAEDPFARISQWLDPGKHWCEAKRDGVSVTLTFGESGNRIESTGHGLDLTRHFPQFLVGFVPRRAGPRLPTGLDECRVA